MADDQQELRRINWTEAFSFTHVFKSFRMAIHPSKIALALAAIILVLVIGNVMDYVWSWWGGTVAPGEIFAKFCTPKSAFEQGLKDREKGLPQQAAGLKVAMFNERYSVDGFQSKLNAGPYKEAFSELNAKKKPDKMPEPLDYQKELNNTKKNWSKPLSAAEDYFKEGIKRIKDLRGDAYDAAKKKIKESSASDDDKKAAYSQLDKDYDASKQALAKYELEFNEQVKAIEGRGIFRSLSEYQWMCVGNAIKAARYGNVFGGLQDFRAKHDATRVPPLTAGPSQPVQNVNGPVPVTDQAGFVYWMGLAVYAFCWLIGEHLVYAIIFLVLCLAIAAVLGGAINRIAAVQFAREEKISIVQALKFSVGKFLSFFTAPLIPLAIIVVLGLLMALGGLLMTIPVLDIIMSVLFFLAIIAGLAVAFLTIGLFAGGGLMYPTIAVEGSDSFDAISRSFSYVFARPWRAALYALVALFYGVITYLFVRFFVYLALLATHYFVSYGIIGQGAPLGPDADKLDILWTAPTFDVLWGRFSWTAMNWYELICSIIIGFWTFLLAASVIAYLLSYAASSTTVIYYLLRQKVDATDLDDVYVEEAEAEPAAAPAAAAPAPEAPAAPAAPAEGGTDKPAV